MPNKILVVPNLAGGFLSSEDSVVLNTDRFVNGPQIREILHSHDLKTSVRPLLPQKPEDYKWIIIVHNATPRKVAGILEHEGFELEVAG